MVHGFADMNNGSKQLQKVKQWASLLACVLTKLRQFNKSYRSWPKLAQLYKWAWENEPHLCSAAYLSNKSRYTDKYQIDYWTHLVTQFQDPVPYTGVGPGCKCTPNLILVALHYDMADFNLNKLKLQFMNCSLGSNRLENVKFSREHSPPGYITEVSAHASDTVQLVL